MTHWRLSRRTTLDGDFNKPSGAPRADTRPNTNSVPTVLGISSLRSVNSGGEIRQPFIHAGELGSYFLLFIIPLFAALVILIGALGYLAFIA